MTATQTRTILALIDFSDATGPVLTAARDIARPWQAKLMLLHVATPEADWEADVVRVFKPKRMLQEVALPDPLWERAAEGRNMSRIVAATEMHRCHRALQILELECRKLGADTTALLVRGAAASASPIRKLLGEIRRIKPDLVVAGSHGHTALHHLLLGSVSTAVIQKAVCPVLVVPIRRSRDKASRPKRST
jgi:nucleotide-binding universal stress UspA family protein